MSNLIALAVFLLCSLVSADVLSDIRKLQAETTISEDKPQMQGLDFQSFQNTLQSMTSE